ncbi:hypothetical protein ANCCAN_09650 [Ancylostoma caninum]|uniref:Uncharacterized protein n=1 Tax=Ancylostoma caninum TaxID=29170 RepID=A0A368GJ04_ANCCA|nr:hypothetical protein ANCCAN_09650 [Ancylostoma caninum]
MLYSGLVVSLLCCMLDIPLNFCLWRLRRDNSSAPPARHRCPTPATFHLQQHYYTGSSTTACTVYPADALPVSDSYSSTPPYCPRIGHCTDHHLYCDPFSRQPPPPYTP